MRVRSINAEPDPCYDSDPREVWYVVVDGIRDRKSCSVFLSASDSISRFLREVRGDNPGVLGSVDMIDIDVYANRKCFQLGTPMDLQLRIASRGSFSDPLVVIPSGKLPATPGPRLIEQAPITMPMCIPPDGARSREILSLRSDVRKKQIHFAGRECAMIKLLRIHIDHYAQRTNQVNRAEQMHPLMDSSPGSGKTTFSRRYLAMIERFIARMTLEQPGIRLAQRKEVITDISAALYWEKGTDVPLGALGDCIAELRKARTVLVELEAGSLLDHALREQRLMEQLSRVVFDTFRTDVGKHDQFPSLIQAIPKPVFIVFDEVGRAFEKEGINVLDQRNEFCAFVGQYGEFLAMQHGVYFVLSGVISFGSLRSLKPISLGFFVRIHMFPIQPHIIAKILQHTFQADEPLSQGFFKDYPLDHVATRLYRITGGHPKALVDLLMREKPFDI